MKVLTTGYVSFRALLSGWKILLTHCCKSSASSILIGQCTFAIFHFGLSGRKFFVTVFLFAIVQIVVNSWNHSWGEVIFHTLVKFGVQY